MSKTPEIHTEQFVVTEVLRYSHERMDEILVAATEGGVDYWAEVFGPDDELDKLGVHPSDGMGSRVLQDREDEDGDRWVVSRLTVELGLRAILSSNEKFELRSRIVESMRDDDSSLIDAGDADTIIQMGLFGRVVFG